VSPFGAKSMPYGGWYAMPRNTVDGFDHRRFRQLSRFAKVKGNSHGAEERHAGRGDNVRSPENQAIRPAKHSANFRNASSKATSRRTVAKCAIHQSFQHGMFRAIHSDCVSANFRRARGLIHARGGRYKHYTNRRSGRAPREFRRTLQGRWQKPPPFDGD